MSPWGWWAPGVQTGIPQMNSERTSGTLRSARVGVLETPRRDLTELMGPKMSQPAIVIRRGILREHERHITE